MAQLQIVVLTSQTRAVQRKKKPGKEKEPGAVLRKSIETRNRSSIPLRLHGIGLTLRPSFLHKPVEKKKTFLTRNGVLKAYSDEDKAHYWFYWPLKYY